MAIADQPEGPYVKSPYNPVTNSGHEVCVWHYDGGIAALLTTDGPEKNTIQWAADGVNFEIMAVLKGAPEAIGLVAAPSRRPARVRWTICAGASATATTRADSGSTSAASRATRRSGHELSNLRTPHGAGMSLYLQARNIRKTYGDIVALEDASLNVREGEILALLGPNGAGKTTFIKILATLLIRNGGTVNVLGYDMDADPESIRHAVGYVGQDTERSAYARLTVRENLVFFGRLRGLSDSLIDAQIRKLSAALRLRRQPGQAVRHALRRPETDGRHHARPTARAAPRLPGRTDKGVGPHRRPPHP